MAVFRPSWVMNFKLKFDETLTITSEPDAVSVEQRLDNPVSPIGRLKPQPLITQLGAENVTFVMNQIPKSASMEKPGYRQAGKWSATFDFNDLPIDPRTVSGASVEIHIGAISDANFAQGMRGRDQDGSVSSVLRTRSESGAPNESTMRMLGIVDEWEVVHDGEGSIITIAGRDLRGILLDTPIDQDPRRRPQLVDELDLSQPIDGVVKQILADNPLFEEFTVVVNPTDWPDSIVPSPGAEGLIPRHRKGARGRKKGGRGTPNSSLGGGNINFWDLIVRFSYIAGGVPYFDAMGRLVIRPTSSIYDQLRGDVDPQRKPTPFQAGQPRGLDFVTGHTISPPLRVRKIVYGRDVESLTFFRKFGGWRRPKTVRAISLNPDSTEKGTGKLLVGVFPPAGTFKPKKTRNAPGSKRPMEEIVNIRVPGIISLPRLTEIAKGLYNEIGRGEVGGTVSTANLSSFGGNNTDPDLLRLDPGDGVEFLIDVRSLRSGSPLVSALTDHTRNSFDEQVALVQRKLKGSPDLARVLVGTARNQIGELQRFFRVQNIKYQWDSEKGISIDFDYQNYIVVRAQVEQANLESGAAQVSSVGTVPLDPNRPTLRNP